MPGATSAGTPSGEHEDAPWVDSFLLTQPGKTYEVGVNEDAHQAAAREAVESVGRDFTDDIVRRTLEGADDDPAAARPDED